MQAFAPNGSAILGTLEKLSGRAEVTQGGYTKNPDGTLEFEYQGGTEIFYDDQETVLTGDPAIAAATFRTALEEIVARVGRGSLSTPTTDDVRSIATAALAAVTPGQRLFLSEDGNEWPEDQIVLRSDEEEADDGEKTKG